VLPLTSKQTDDLLDLIYDAAGDEILWPTVLTRIADHTCSQGGILFGQSLNANRVYFDFNGRLDEECNKAYQQRHMDNPWSHAMETRAVGEIVFSDEVVELASLRKSAFYDEVLRPQNVAHNGMIALAAKRDFRAAFNICRSNRRGEFGEDERRFLGFLAPHLQRSARLGFKLGGYQILQTVSFDALNHLADGAILLDHAGRPLFANTAAIDLEKAGTISIRNPLTTYSGTYTQQLGLLVRSALSGGAGGVMAMASPHSHDNLTIMVSSLRSRDISRFSDHGLKDAAVLLFLINPTHRDSFPAQHLADAYGLTQAETRVALALASAISIPEAAAQLNLSPNTVKTQAHRVFSKTGTQGQAGLVKLITALEAYHF
jgi:DNA-binding CsgD family transcriptional regulator